MKITDLLKFADFFTIGNLFCGVLSVFFSSQERFMIAASLLILAVVFDVLDGKIAGLMHQKNNFGKQLDSLADLVSFGVAPAFLYFSLNTQKAVGIAVLLFFVACGMLRLARYNISEGKGFDGIPITLNGVLFPLLFFISTIAPESLEYWPWIFLLQGFLMISSLKVQRLF